jgi:mRNA interferase RelE/StbE
MIRVRVKISSLKKYTIVFSKTAEKSLKTFDREDKIRILSKVKELAGDNDNLDIKKLKSCHLLYRLRIGNFRVIYNIQNDRLIIYVVAVGHRKHIYKTSGLG